jgi:adenylate cyclase
MQKDLREKASYYEERYGLVPAFKAGLHVGPVTTGEIGALKREIFFTGDVLNVTARIQSLCNTYKADLLISENLLDLLKHPSSFTFNSLGSIPLKGRVQSMVLFEVSKTNLNQG